MDDVGIVGMFVACVAFSCVAFLTGIVCGYHWGTVDAVCPRKKKFRAEDAERK